MNFNHAAHTYHEFAYIQKTVVNWAWSFFDHNLLGKSVIELGSGTGLLTEYILTRHPKSLLAVDKSLLMLDESFKRLNQFNNIHWTHADAWSLRATPVDYIFSSNLLQWTDFPLVVLQNWLKLLKNKGYAVFIFFIKGTLMELYDVLPQSNFIIWRSYQEWEYLIKTVGFNIIDSREGDSILHFQSSLELLRTLKNTGVICPNRIKYSFLREATLAYNSKYGQKEGVPSTWRYCYFLCQKDN